MLRSFSKFIMRLWGWRVTGEAPQTSKYILIGIPHTSNWDFPLALLALSSLGIRFNWVAKHTLFRGPLDALFRAIGGIPVDRSSGAAFLMKILDLYETRDKLILAIAPEGTRSKTSSLKSGFYVLATRAKVPVVMGYIDYPTKTIGIGDSFVATGNMDEDLEIIKKFYDGKKGKYPEMQGEIKIKGKSRRRKKS